MPWDNSLNMDIVGDFIIHVLLTDDFKKQNYSNYTGIKYFIETPQYGFKAYKK